MADYGTVRRAAKLHAKSVLSSNVGVCLAATAIVGAVSLLGDYVASFYAPELDTLMRTDDVLTLMPALYKSRAVSLFFDLLFCPLMMGAYALAMALVRGRKMPLTEIFTWFGEGKRLGRAFGANLYYLFLSVAWMVVYIGLPSAVIVGLDFWPPMAGLPEPFYSILLYAALLALLVCAVLAEIRILAYLPALLIVADTPERGVRAAFRENAVAMRGRRWEFFVLNLSFILWFLTASFTCGLSLLYVMPYYTLTLCAFTAHVRSAAQGYPPQGEGPRA